MAISCTWFECFNKPDLVNLISTVLQLSNVGQDISAFVGMDLDLLF
jgi:hypothetical protein